MKVAVLTGGVGTERDVSLESGKCVSQGLREAQMHVVTVDVAPDRLSILDDESIDVFFLALHGQFGEDGQLQQVLEDRSLVYTGSGPAASKLAFDKVASKQAFAKAGINTPGAIQVSRDADVSRLEKQLQQFTGGFVIKPQKQGSSVGISIVAGVGEAVAAARETSNKFGNCIIEEFIPGRELTVGILCNRPLPIIEIRTQTDFYDYHAKYVDENTQYLFDTIEDTEKEADIQTTAVDCFNATGCRHFARVDFILDDDGVLYALELNTIPGFTTHSLLPRAAAKAGLPMSGLCAKIIETAMENNKLKTIR